VCAACTRASARLAVARLLPTSCPPVSANPPLPHLCVNRPLAAFPLPFAVTAYQRQLVTAGPLPADPDPHRVPPHEQSVQPLVLDTPVTTTVAQGHTNTYTYHHVEGGDSALTIAITPTFGDPDLYVSLGSNLAETLARQSFDKFEESPGDDVMLLHVEPAKPFVVIVVEGADASEYTMVISTDQSLIPLSNGRSVRYEAAADAYRFFSVTVDAPGDVRFAVTPLTGDPDLFVALNPRPTETNAVWASAEPEQAERLHRYEHLTILGTDPNRCTSMPCVYYLSVLADRGPSTYSVVAWWGDQPVRLVEGVPQAGQVCLCVSCVGRAPCRSLVMGRPSVWGGPLRVGPAWVHPLPCLLDSTQTSARGMAHAFALAPTVGGPKRGRRQPVHDACGRLARRPAPRAHTRVGRGKALRQRGRTGRRRRVGAQVVL